MNLEIVNVDSDNIYFKELIKLLDQDLNERYGKAQEKYNKFNKVDSIKDVVIILLERIPVACGAFKEYNNNTIELKRIFVRKENRGQGISKALISELEHLGRKNGYEYALLETGTKQHEAINLYKSSGYDVIENYEPFVGYEESICMKKAL